MRSRERVLAALNHSDPDRVPVDFSGHRSSGISAIAYKRLRKYLGLCDKPIRVYDIIQQLAVVDEDVLDLFRIDTIEMGRGFARSEEDWHEWVLPDGSLCLIPAWVNPIREDERWELRAKSGKVLGQMPAGALYFEQISYPLIEKPDLEDDLETALEESMWTAIPCPPEPSASGSEGDEALRNGARWLRDHTDRAIIGLFGGNLFEIGQFLFRNDQFFMVLAGEPERAERFLDRLVERHLNNLERYLNLVGPYIDIILFGDDLGMQSGPQISPRMYRQIFKPRHQLLWQRAKQLADVKVMLHCCGGVRELLPDLIEAGLDAINPVQITCRGMEAEGLKRDFGKDITFWGGGCDTQEVLIHASPKQVREHVRRQVDTLSPGGGFVFQQVHNILADVPPENIVAMFEEVNR